MLPAGEDWPHEHEWFIWIGLWQGVIGGQAIPNEYGPGFEVLVWVIVRYEVVSFHRG